MFEIGSGLLAKFSNMQNTQCKQLSTSKKSPDMQMMSLHSSHFASKISINVKQVSYNSRKAKKNVVGLVYMMIWEIERHEPLGVPCYVLFIKLARAIRL